MKDSMEIVLVILIIGIAVLVGIFQAWLFIAAPCSTVKEFWMITQVPGRCINL